MSTRYAGRMSTVVLNDFGGARLEQRTRQRQAGPVTHMTLSIKSEPILHDFDNLKIGRAAAEAIAALIRRQIEGIGEAAGVATQLKRKYAESAFAAGKRWALERYSGGKIGARKPAQTERLFNDSGRLAAGIVATENKTEGAWTINVAANRLDPRTFGGGEAGISRMVQRLVSLVPALRGDVLRDETVKRAIDEGIAEAIYVMTAGAKQRNAKAWRDLVGSVAGETARFVFGA